MTKNDNYFIKISDALEMIEKLTEKSLGEISINLYQSNFQKTCPMYTKNSFFEYNIEDSKELSIYKNTHEILKEMSEKGERDCLIFTADKTVYTSIENSFKNTCNYWLRHIFFNNEYIQSIGLIDDLIDYQSDNPYLISGKVENQQQNNDSLNTRERNSVQKIITILADMAGLPKDNPSTAFNMMEAHAARNGLEIPSTNTVTKWLREEN